ncbi:hypothetical protein PoB_003941500 [Plakobranchus ocellatus]|uniref:Uncharacterized protein n=1 Tax=Plakobranchus ocellatus TaxID=259542 RepID=A0AAV4AX28_9GAST|nr:hypothetical protein PoB_003941500 [Plakobranchus ocellatus]
MEGQGARARKIRERGKRGDRRRDQEVKREVEGGYGERDKRKRGGRGMGRGQKKTDTGEEEGRKEGEEAKVRERESDGEEIAREFNLFKISQREKKTLNMRRMKISRYDLKFEGKLKQGDVYDSLVFFSFHLLTSRT